MNLEVEVDIENVGISLLVKYTSIESESTG